MLMGLINKAVDGMTNVVKQYQNKEFLEAVVAASVLVGMADGDLEPSERVKMNAAIRNSNDLKVYSADQINSVFKETLSKMELDYTFGKAELLSIVGKVSHDLTQSRKVLAVCKMIAGADGATDEKETRAIQEITRALGL